MRPSLAAASMVKNCGVFAARAANVREPKPMPSAPQALPKAMSKRSRPDLSSRLNATRWPPASSTATVSGAQLVVAAFLERGIDDGGGLSKRDDGHIDSKVQRVEIAGYFAARFAQ